MLLGKVDASGRLPFTWYADEARAARRSPTTTCTRPTTTAGRTYQYFTGPVAYPFGLRPELHALRLLEHLARRERGARRTARSRSARRCATTGTAAGPRSPQLYVTTPFAPAVGAAAGQAARGLQQGHAEPGRDQDRHLQGAGLQAGVLRRGQQHVHGRPGHVRAAGRVLQRRATSSSPPRSQVSGTIADVPTVVTAKPIQTGDKAQGVAQRVMVDINRTIDPQLTVSMADQSLYGYITKGQSKPLPAGLAVSYSSNRPGVGRPCATASSRRSAAASPPSPRR